MERECVARLACRPPPTTTHYPGGLEGGSRSEFGGGGGALKWEFLEDAAAEFYHRCIQIQTSQMNPQF